MPEKQRGERLVDKGSEVVVHTPTGTAYWASDVRKQRTPVEADVRLESIETGDKIYFENMSEYLTTDYYELR